MHTAAIRRSHRMVLKATARAFAPAAGTMQACADTRGATVVRDDMRFDSRFVGMAEDRWDGGMGGMRVEMLSRRVPG